MGGRAGVLDDPSLFAADFDLPLLCTGREDRRSSDNVPSKVSAGRGDHNYSC